MLNKTTPFFLTGILAMLPCTGIAHPAEQALVLLLPTELYTAGGTFAVVASIALISLVSHHHVVWLYRNATLAAGAQLSRLARVTSFVATLAFFALIYVGLNGPNDPQRNLFVLTIWTGWWVGLFVIQGLIMDLWRWINPWSGLHALCFGGRLAPFKLPHWVGRWPAFVMFIAFQMFLLADIAPSDPDRLSRIALLYWLFIFAGMALFGRRAIAQQVECFTVLFSLITALRPVQMTDKMRIGLPGWASLRLAPLSAAGALFCITILVSGSFDGLKETFWWLGRIGINPLEFPGRSAVVWPSIIGLIGANIAVVLIYALCLWAGIKAAQRFGTLQPVAFFDVFNTFAISFLQIALGYHFAHYFVSFLVQVQYLAAALADPLAQGWNLFGLGRIRVTTGFLNSTETVKPILLINVCAVVASHNVAVAMAHILAGRFTTDRRTLILLQVFLSALMICYTIFGLWLLSTPRGA